MREDHTRSRPTRTRLPGPDLGTQAEFFGVDHQLLQTEHLQIDHGHLAAQQIAERGCDVEKRQVPPRSATLARRNDKYFGRAFSGVPRAGCPTLRRFSKSGRHGYWFPAPFDFCSDVLDFGRGQTTIDAQSTATPPEG